MDNKIVRQQGRDRLQRIFIVGIIILVVIFIGLIVFNKKLPGTIERRPFEGEVKTYDGSLHRNLLNPIGSE